MSETHCRVQAPGRRRENGGETERQDLYSPSINNMLVAKVNWCKLTRIQKCVTH